MINVTSINRPLETDRDESLEHFSFLLIGIGKTSYDRQNRNYYLQIRHERWYLLGDYGKPSSKLPPGEAHALLGQ